MVLVCKFGEKVTQAGVIKENWLHVNFLWSAVTRLPPALRRRHLIPVRPATDVYRRRSHPLSFSLPLAISLSLTRELAHTMAKSMASVRRNCDSYDLTLKVFKFIELVD